MPTTDTVADWNERLKRIMPFGSSTSSKAPRFLPEEPQVIVRGKGCRVWDDRGREFIDFRNSLGPVTLGYCFPAVDDAIRAQLENGIIFGHPHPLECEVAELLSDVIPCAEQVRFLKTGGEAMAATFKAARAFTGRDHIVQLGYNGWLNSLARNGMHLPGQITDDVTPAGVPADLSKLHHHAGWNKPDEVEHWFEHLPDQIAAVAVAADYLDIEAGRTFYQFLREITEKHGALLIFDEIVTGFRLALGGVQEMLGVTPDLAVFAKGIANGMPLSTYLGRRDVMMSLETAIVSSTYGGETLSLAAAKAAIETYRNENVIDHLWRQGDALRAGVNPLLKKHGLQSRLAGMGPIPFWHFHPDEADDIMRSAYRHGVSMYNCCYVNFSHKDADIAEAVQRLDRAFDDVTNG